MKNKIEENLRAGEYERQDAGEGVFYCLKYEPSREEEDAIYKTAILLYQDVQWCPDPECHGEEFYAVLNCFHPADTNKYVNEDGSLKKENMHYCMYHWVNVFDDTCEDCLVKCGGANKQPFDPKSDYMI